MNSNNSDKVKNFFRKEGFYFVLFICLCVIATVAVFTINRNSTANKDNSVEENLSLNVEENTSLEPSMKRFKMQRELRTLQAMLLIMK